MKTVLKVVALVVLFVACGPSASDYTDAGACPPNATLCGDRCIALDTHPDHCGVCGNVCPTGSNACVAGICVCESSDGTRHSADPCDYPAVCDQTGYCLTPDPTGEHCDEIEGIECDAPNTACVESFCTLIDCDHEEVCNLRDDNCNGLTDQLELGVYLTQSCYSGDPAEVGVGICREGEQNCVAGGWTPCTGEQLPTNEEGLLACDNVDGDCNGCVDDHYDDEGNLLCGTPEQIESDVAFIVDISGSMSSTHTAVTSTMSAHVTNYAPATWIRWGIVQVALPANPVDLLQPLTDFMAFLTSLATLSIDGGYEPTYEAVLMTTMDSFTSPELDRAPDARLVIVVFGDETAQGWNNTLGLTETEVCDAVNAAGAVLAVFTHPDFFEEWDECAITYTLTSDASVMTAQLDELFERACLEAP